MTVPRRKDGDGTVNPADMALRANPSVRFDAVAVLSGPEGDKTVGQNPDAVSFPMDAHRLCRAVSWRGGQRLSEKAGVGEGAGLVDLDGKSCVRDCVDAAQADRFWKRQAELDPAIRGVRKDGVRAKGRKSPTAP